jgi:hypothetical protein
MKRLRTSAFITLAFLPLILNIALRGKPITRYQQWSVAKMQHRQYENNNGIKVDTLAGYYSHSGK